MQSMLLLTYQQVQMLLDILSTVNYLPRTIKHYNYVLSDYTTYVCIIIMQGVTLQSESH